MAEKLKELLELFQSLSNDEQTKVIQFVEAFDRNRKTQNQIYTIPEICEILGVKPRTVYKYIREDKLNAFKVGNHWRVTDEALQDFLKRGTK